MGYFTIYDRYQVDDLWPISGEKYQVFRPSRRYPAPNRTAGPGPGRGTYAKNLRRLPRTDGGALPFPGDFNPRPRT